MSSNRSKNTKRLSLRKTKIAKSPITKKNRTQHTSLGLPPSSLTLNTTVSGSNHSAVARKLPRPKSAHLASSISKQAAIHNIFETTSTKPKSWKKSLPSTLEKHSPITAKPTQCHIRDSITIEDDEEDDLTFMNPPSINTDNLSGSSISDILGPMASLHEDSDDEAAAKAMLQMLGSRHNSAPRKMRPIQSSPVLSAMLSPDAAHSLFSQHNPSAKIETVHKHNTQIIVQNTEQDTSPSSESTNNMDKDVMYLTPSQSAQHIRYRSQSMSGQSNGDRCPYMEGVDDEHSSYINSVPETNAVIKNDDGLMTYTTTSTCPRLLPLQTRTSRRSNAPHHRSFSSLGTKDKKRQKHKQKRKQKQKRYRSYELGCRHENMVKREFLSDLYEERERQRSNEYDTMDRVSDDSSEYNQKKNGVQCEMKLGSEWDCLTVSHNQEWVALFSRNSMTLLKITEYGTFEQLRDLKAGRKDSRLKYGAVDAQFYYNDACKLISCTRSGILIVINLNCAGRGCVALTKCPLKQRVHKVTWIRDTECCLAAAEDGKCYLWDTRSLRHSCSFNSSSSALSVRTSPFNDHLFASSHKNGTLSVWDIRNGVSPFLTMTAHKSSINCIDWHPAIPNVISSCGYRDITIKVWNLTDDEVAQQRYYDYWNKMSLSAYNQYNYEDDYRLGQDVVASTSPVCQWQSQSQSQSQCLPNKLEPKCAMYPSGHVSQIGWRPCNDPRSLSANQIACSYVGSEQVVEMWDIKSSYVPVASLSSHESETKFKFLHKNRAFRNDDDDVDSNESSHTPRTYIITCSKDKCTKLTDCGFADIPRSKLSSCALDISPFGRTCFVSVARQKLHPFDEETYRYLAMHEETGAGADGEESTDSSSDELESTDELRKSLQSSSCGELRNELFLSVAPQRRAHRSFNAISSDSEYTTQSQAPSSTRSVSTMFSGMFTKSKKNKECLIIDAAIEKKKNKECLRSINAMSGGFKQSKIMQLTDIFNHVDAFSEYSTLLLICDDVSPSVSVSVSPCDCAFEFKYLAQHYVLNGTSIPWICKENEMVSRDIGNKELQRLWNLLGVLLNNVLSSNNNELPKISSSAASSSHSVVAVHIDNTDVDDEDDDDDDDDDHELSNTNEDDAYDWWMDAECSPGPYISSASNHSYLSMHSTTPAAVTPPMQLQMHCTTPLKQLEYALNDDDVSITKDECNADGEAAMVASYIKDVLLENIDRGDIQTAVTIIVMLDKYITQYLSQQEIADIVLSYLDLLLHSRLLCESVKVYQLTKHYPLISKYFLSKHRLIIKCIRCRDAMRDYQCFKCRKYARCTQCNEQLIQTSTSTTLKHPKLLIWCQICGHGGHFDHMKSWFKNEKKTQCCIDACYHECQPVLIAIEDTKR